MDEQASQFDLETSRKEAEAIFVGERNNNQPRGLELAEDGQVALHSTADLKQFFNHLLRSRALPSHLDTVERLLLAHQLLTGLGLNWLACLKDTWINPKTNQLALCNNAPLAAVQMRPDYIATVEYHVNEKSEMRTRHNFVGFNIAGAVCIARREGRPDCEGFYDLSQAKMGDLMKKNNWAQHPAAMLKMRARAIALTAQWTDVLGGIPIAEMMDFDDDTQGPARAARKASSVKQRFARLIAQPQPTEQPEVQGGAIAEKSEKEDG